MNPILASVAALAVACIYCIWRFYLRDLLRRRRLLSERVAYMLWIVADRGDRAAPADSGPNRRI